MPCTVHLYTVLTAEFDGPDGALEVVQYVDPYSKAYFRVFHLKSHEHMSKRMILKHERFLSIMIQSFVFQTAIYWKIQIAPERLRPCNLH